MLNCHCYINFLLKNENIFSFLRVLGKFGGGNRKMMIEPQNLNYCTTESMGPEVVVHFQDQTKPIHLPVAKVSVNLLYLTINVKIAVFIYSLLVLTNINLNSTK